MFGKKGKMQSAHGYKEYKAKTSPKLIIAVVIAKYVMVNVISGYRNEKKEDE